MAQYKTPGVYVEEISKFPPSVAGVATAIPAFIGYTEEQPKNGDLNPVKVSSLLDYEKKFGARQSYAKKNCVLYDSMRLFYDNGGGECYVVSVGKYDKAGTPDKEDYKKAIDALEKVDEVTLVLFPDAAKLFTANELGDIQKKALEHCAKMGDRFAILDISLKKDDSQDTSAQNNTNKKEGDGDDINQVEVTTPKVDATSEELCDQFRNNIGTNNLSYGAAYYPYVITSYSKDISYDEVTEELKSLDKSLIKDTFFAKAKATEKYKNIFVANPSEEQEKAIDQAEKEIEADRLFKINEIIAKSKEYQEKVAEMEAKMNILPPSGAIAGIICSTDRTKGVWQAPANVSLAGVKSLSEDLTDDDQAKMNVVSNGKSINAIRKFTGKGLLVWGARTLDGNSNEWKYIPVRRLFNYIEESVQKSTSWAVFQPNDANTWVKIQCQIENFLTSLWRDGALAGSTPDKAFYVKVGLNETMTSDDILNGNLIVEIGLAAVRPAEFVVLKFSHKVQE